MNELEKIKLMQSVAEDPKARRAFAASLSIPVRQVVAEQTSVRSIFAEDPLPAGALASYPCDFGETTAWLLPRLGATPVNQVDGDEVLVPTFEITGRISFKMSYARDGRYNVSDRAKQRLANDIIKQEEEAGWSVIRASVPASNVITVAGTEGTYFSKKLINEMIAKMQSIGLEPSLIVCSVNSFAEIREWDNTKLDEVTRREVFQNAGLKSIWGVPVMALRRLADTEVYLFDTSRYGVMPIRQNLVTFDDPTVVPDLKIGIIAYEEIGFGVLDSRAVVKGVITRS
jgi:hypothetical protein